MSSLYGKVHFWSSGKSQLFFYHVLIESSDDLPLKYQLVFFLLFFFFHSSSFSLFFTVFLSDHSFLHIYHSLDPALALTSAVAETHGWSTKGCSSQAAGPPCATTACDNHHRCIAPVVIYPFHAPTSPIDLLQTQTALSNPAPNLCGLFISKILYLLNPIRSNTQTKEEIPLLPLDIPPNPPLPRRHNFLRRLQHLLPPQPRRPIRPGPIQKDPRNPRNRLGICIAA